ncbi:hypothetical protein NC651_016907 [Populus alba x Populus x berolinensis]|nr:hypothetical protein NC651_016907 [Populus alba x Populus x berolinensis]
MSMFSMFRSTNDDLCALFVLRLSTRDGQCRRFIIFNCGRKLLATKGQLSDVTLEKPKINLVLKIMSSM